MQEYSARPWKWRQHNPSECWYSFTSQHITQHLRRPGSPNQCSVCTGNRTGNNKVLHSWQCINLTTFIALSVWHMALKLLESCTFAFLDLYSPHITKRSDCVYLYKWVNYLLPFPSLVLYKHYSCDVHKTELSALPSLTSRLGSRLYCTVYWTYRNIIHPIGLGRFDCVHNITKIREMFCTEAQSQQKPVMFFTLIHHNLPSRCECIIVPTTTNDWIRVWINIYNNVQ